MDLGRWRQMQEVLDVALESDPASWPSILDESCSADPELRREVEALLARLGTAEGFLDSPPAALAAALVAEAREQSSAETYEDRRIGPYRIVRQIGRGGMARVFLAERADGHFEQRVALKLLRPGLDSEIDQERFRAERQILASLNHAHIARLLDGGVTGDGQPYLVLEHVEGQPIDVFCEQRALSVRQRLELFLTVAGATQAAHRSLVVHRDLKPSNILVSVDGVVKLLDFGLAKLLEPGVGSDRSPATRTGQRWMTPEYAAPEQIRGEPITTLTDVYQLGAVLYQLLTRQLPFAACRHPVANLEAAVLQEDPAPPSAVVATANAEHGRLLRGDLDAIVLKAMRKEPEERYGSPDELARDIGRHLRGEPVLAQRQTAAYRARRFVRRHRV
jgi:serine/threonine protein kinase